MFMLGSAPIIDPWIFYWIETINALKYVFGGLACLSGIIALIVICVKLDTGKINYKLLISSSALFLFFLLLTVFTPSKNTIYTMTVAEFVTTDNLEILYEATGDTAEDILNGTSDFVKDIIDYSVDKVIEVKGEVK